LNAINRSYKFYQRHQDFSLGKVKVKKSIKSLGTKSSMLNEMESKSILNKIGLAIPNFFNEKHYSENYKPTEEFSLKFPVCLKMLSNEVQHKTDIGAIDLNIKNYQELLTSFEKIKKQVEQSKENFSNNFLVEEMQPEPLGELLVGIFYDLQFGYVMTLASGGVLANLIEDSVTILLPASIHELDKSLGKLKINKLFQGYRGKKEINRKLLLGNLKKLTDFALDKSNNVQQIEINPLFVFPEKNIAVDGIIWKNE